MIPNLRPKTFIACWIQIYGVFTTISIIEFISRFLESVTKVEHAGVLKYLWRKTEKLKKASRKKKKNKFPSAI